MQNCKVLTKNKLNGTQSLCTETEQSYLLGFESSLTQIALNGCRVARAYKNRSKDRSSDVRRRKSLSVIWVTGEDTKKLGKN